MADNFEKLAVWKKAHELVIEVYRLTKNFPSEEKYSLTDQVRRSAASVPTNIVEGNERQGKKEYLQFLYIAKGSLIETRYHLLLAKDLGYLKPGDYDSISSKSLEVAKMLNGLINFIKSSAPL